MRAVLRFERTSLGSRKKSEFDLKKKKEWQVGLSGSLRAEK